MRVFQDLTVVQSSDKDAFNKWSVRMLKLTKTISEWSPGPEGRQHGCVLAYHGIWVVSTGYNSTAIGTKNCDCEGKNKIYCLVNCRAVHAEVNAILTAARLGVRLMDSIAYVTKRPCEPCCSAMANAGVVAAYFTETGIDHLWIDSLVLRPADYDRLKDAGSLWRTR